MLPRKRINLIAEEFLPPTKDSITPSVMALLLIFSGFSLSKTLYERRKISQDQSSLAQKRDELKARLEEIKQKQAAPSRLEERRKTIAEIRARKIEWSQPMKELSMRIHKGVWLDELTATLKDGKRLIEIKGSAAGSDLFNDFFSTLETSYFYKRVMIDYAELDATVSPSIYRFRLYGPLEEGKNL